MLLKLANTTLESRIKQKEGASDVVQKSLIEAHKDFRQCDSTSLKGFEKWLSGIVKNNIKDAHRRYLLAEKRRVTKERPIASDDVKRLLDQLSLRRQPGPESQAIRRENHARAKAALESLDRAYRQVLLWRFRDGLKYEEIGKKFDRSPNAARMLCERALAKFTAILGISNDE